MNFFLGLGITCWVIGGFVAWQTNGAAGFGWVLIGSVVFVVGSCN